VQTLPPRLRRAGRDAKAEGGGVLTLLKYKRFQNMLVLYGCESSARSVLTAVNNGILMTWEAFFPLFAFTSPELGGLGLTVCCPVSTR